MSRNTADDRGHMVQGPVAADTADQHALERTDPNAHGAAQARSEPQEQRRVSDVAHGNPCHGDVLQDATIDRRERDAAAALEHAISNSDAPKPAVRFRAALDATGALPTMFLESVQKR